MSGKRRGRWWAALAASAVLFLAFSAASAQSPPPGVSGLRIYDEQLRVQLDEQQAAARQTGLDGGGWFNLGYFHFDDAASGNKDRNLLQPELRLWANYTYQGVHTLYARGVIGWDNWLHSGNPGGGENCEFDQVRLERGFYKFDYNRLVRNQTGQNPQAGFTFELGRDFYTIGSGFVLAEPLDAVTATANWGDWKLTGLLGHTVTHTANIDDSAPVQDHMDRCIWGTELRTVVASRHEPYIYWLGQTDHTDAWGDRVLAADQGFRYSSGYLGAGSRGSFEALPDLRYGGEFVWESGRDFGRGSENVRDDIEAYAVDLLLEYYFTNVPKRPKVSAEYIWGSGDWDRQESSTATVGGNTAGTRDRSFNAFGFRDTGLAFAPRFANLHIYELGAGFFPLEEMPLFRRMEVGSKLYFYEKQTAGPISDTTATDDSRWVGWEWDAFVNWRLTSDLSWTVRYGVFFPGSAFEDTDCRSFLYTGVSLSF